jgi:hypothetical protein
VVDVAGHMTVDVETPGFGALIAQQRAVPPRKAPIETSRSEDDYSDQVILLGRLKAGTTTESRRVVHVFLLAPGLLHDSVVKPRCGRALPAGDMQWLPGMTGMPCEQCVMARC